MVAAGSVPDIHTNHDMILARAGVGRGSAARGFGRAVHSLARLRM